MTKDEETRTLKDTKKLVSRSYLGKYGIHSVGVQEQQNAVRVYASGQTKELGDAIHKIEALCAPYGVDLVVEGMASIWPNNISLCDAVKLTEERLKQNNAFWRLITDGVFSTGVVVRAESSRQDARNAIRQAVLHQQAGDELSDALDPIASVVCGVVANLLTRWIEQSRNSKTVDAKGKWVAERIDEYLTKFTDLSSAQKSEAKQAIKGWLISKLDALEGHFNEMVNRDGSN